MMNEHLFSIFPRIGCVAWGNGMVARTGIALDDNQKEKMWKAVLYMTLLITNNSGSLQLNT